MNKLESKYKEDVVLLDVEGTTCSIRFVKDTLFPFARDSLKNYIEQNLDSEEMKAVVKLLKDQVASDENNNVAGLVRICEDNDELKKKTIKENILWQMDNDRKTSGLKLLQGYIWQSGYETGQLKAEFFDDVKPALVAWKNAGKKIYIYSSGSVLAQKLIFKYTTSGDYSEYIDGYFDTLVGPKVERSSYENIANQIECSTKDILFLTDIVAEANAASSAGCKVVISVRPGNAPIPEVDKNRYPLITSFSDLFINMEGVSE